MARYHFNLHECGLVTLDDEGVERSGIASIRAEALRAARGIMCAELSEGRLCLSCHIEVKDAAGATMLILPFTDAVTITGS